VLDGGSGTIDVLKGEDGDDILRVSGNSRGSLNGGIGNDVIEGGSANDNIAGGSGTDRISGGGGNDLILGGSQSDTFVFEDNFGVDRLTDFSSVNTEDIDLSGVTNITDFADLLANHLATDGGTGFALIVDGGNSIRLDGWTVADIGGGLALSNQDFIF
jgi:Ca2+-binding RTX toxin-like protein